MSKSRNDRRRRKLTGSKAFDPTCRNHGSCPACRSNRTIAERRQREKGIE